MAANDASLELGLKLKHLDRFLAKISGVFAAKSDIPTKVSELENDSGYVTVAGGLRTWADLPDEE